MVFLKMVMRDIDCRVCKKSIPVWDWQSHVKIHKIGFCNRLNLDPKNWHEVGWENVVKFFNPEEIKSLGFGNKSVVVEQKGKQKFLTEFLK